MSQSDLLSTRPVAMLLVDDHAEDLLTLEVILEDCGAELVKASSGAEALRNVLRRDFAVILLDVSMPGMSGFEVAELLKQGSRSRHIPIIFLTAESTDLESIYRGYRAGGVDYILKPLDPDVVRAKVAVFVELHRRAQDARWQADLLRAAERERRETEIAELRAESERHYRSLAEAMPHIVWTAQPNGEISYFNQRWTDCTGRTFSESLGRGWQSSIHPEDVRRFLEQWRRALVTGQPLRTGFRLRDALGDYRFHVCEALPERDQDGRLVGWLGTFTDVSDELELDEAPASPLLYEPARSVDAAEEPPSVDQPPSEQNPRRSGARRLRGARLRLLRRSGDR